jgi:hypothetical protein
VEKKWHVCNPLSIAENSQEIQHDRIYRRDRPSRAGMILIAMMAKGWDVLVPKVLDLHELAILSSIRVTVS